MKLSHVKFPSINLRSISARFFFSLTSRIPLNLSTASILLLSFKWSELPYSDRYCLRRLLLKELVD